MDGWLNTSYCSNDQLWHGCRQSISKVSEALKVFCFSLKIRDQNNAASFENLLPSHLGCGVIKQIQEQHEKRRKTRQYMIKSNK